jgi:alpha-ribazole phosphatase/probable phosphoglycerate mutase
MELVTCLLLVRHAETDMAGRFCGHSDPELNERGRQQLAGLVNGLSEHTIRRVFASDLRRARQTAEAIAQHFGAELHIRPGLREIHFGLWEGLSWTEIAARDPVLAKNWAEGYPDSTAPGGEAFQQFKSRVRGEIAFLLGQAMKLPIAVVTHAGFICAVLMNWCRVSEQQAWDRTRDYASVVALDTNHIDKAIMEDSDHERSEARAQRDNL